MRSATAATPPVLLLSFLLAALPQTCFGCTAILAGRLATSDGSVLASHSDDGEGTNDPRIVLVPAAAHDPGATRPVAPDTENYPRYVGRDRGSGYFPENVRGDYADTVPIGRVAQVGATFKYVDGNYGFMNERQVVAGGESTCSGVFSATAVGSGGEALFSINELSRVALERSTTAREAVDLMGSLATAHGFYGASGSFEGGAESLMVADTMEGWSFHILPDDTGTSAVWVAKKVPDDEVTVVANMFTIREVDLDDAENYMGDPYMYEVAKRNGLWSEEDGPLDFTKVFSNGEYSHKYYSGRRMWGAFRLLAPSLDLSPEYDDIRLEAAYPWSVKPEKLLSVKDIFAIHRNYYENTPFDLSAGVAAGPFGDPDRLTDGAGEEEVARKYGRGAWERSIALFRTTYTTVMQARSWLEDGRGGYVWIGEHAAHGTCFLPFPIGAESLPDSITRGKMTELDKSSAFWTFRYVHSLSRLRFRDLSKVVRAEQDKWEDAALELQACMDASDDPPTSEVLAEAFGKHTEDVLKAWWAMADKLVFLYADGFRNSDGSGEPEGYPANWLEAVGYQNGPPPPPKYQNHMLINVEESRRTEEGKNLRITESARKQ